MKQYIVVEKDGQKWLRPYHPDEAIYGPPKMVVWDKPYIGEKPAGTKLDENQIQQTVSWAIPVGEVSYTDADHIPDVGEVVDKPFKVANVRVLVNQMLAEEISFSRFVEILNEIANDKHIHS